MSANMDLYNKVREVPEEAKREITGTRFKGFTDINPMWRIKTLTEHFGVVGIGWYYDIVKTWLEKGHGAVVAAFVQINLFIKVDGEWSKPITGIGGSTFVADEKNGPYTTDECYKMALTDAISVSCKALGIGADVYYKKDRSKYNRELQEQKKEYRCCDCGTPFKGFTDKKGKFWSASQVYYMAGSYSPDKKPRCRQCLEKSRNNSEVEVSVPVSNKVVTPAHEKQTLQNTGQVISFSNNIKQLEPKTTDNNIYQPIIQQSTIENLEAGAGF